MNQHSEEIYNQLTDMSKKYNIKRGILLFEEADKDKTNELHHRVIVFEPDTIGFNVNTFANLFLKCINISKTFQMIMDKASDISLIEMIKDIRVQSKLNSKSRKQVN